MALTLGCGSPDSVDLAPVELKLLYPAGGLGDRSFADSVYRGVIVASLEVDLRLTQAAPSDAREATAVLEEWLAMPPQRAELIVAVGSAHAPALLDLGCDLNGRYLLHLDTSLPSCPRRQSVEYRGFAAAFLAGVAAMAVSPRRRAAVIAGRDLPAVDELIRGFRAGVEHAGGELGAVEYLSDGEDGFANPSYASEVADRLYADADVIFPVAGGSGVGVIERAKTWSDRYVIGVDSDQSWLGRGVVVASVVKHLDHVVSAAIMGLAAGDFSEGTVALGLPEGGTDLILNERFARLQDVVDASRSAAESAAHRDREASP